MTLTVRIPWTREYDNEYKWNEVCARADTAEPFLASDLIKQHFGLDQ